jgi:hypothetical protein
MPPKSFRTFGVFGMNDYVPDQSEEKSVTEPPSGSVPQPDHGRALRFQSRVICKIMGPS